MKTVIEMAREAGLHRQQHNLMSNPVQYRFSYDGYEENLERFVELVRADEREACVQDIQMHIPRSGRDTTEYQRAMRMIERIRARSKT